MSDKPIIPDLRKLLALFDKHIYCSFSMSPTAQSFVSRIAWNEVRKMFAEAELFMSSLILYNQTIIKETTPKNGFKSYPLVISCEVDDLGLKIEHDAKALSTYLFNEDKSAVENSAVTDLFLNALDRFKMRGDILYYIISKGKQHTTTPEQLKEQLGITYKNAMFNRRILSPVEETIHALYQSGRLPFYIKITTKRNVIGVGRKMTNVVIDVFNEIDMLQLARMRADYMKYIMEKLIKFFPFDYPFIEDDLNKSEDKTIEQIFQMVKDIDSDPDFGKLPESTLIKYKLRQEFGIHCG